MKTLFTLLAAAGLAGAAFAAEKWTKPQQEVADVFKTWAAAEVAGDKAKVMTLLSPELTVWNFKETPAPLDHAGFDKVLTDFFQTMKVGSCRMETESVLIKEAFALAHGHYSEICTDPKGQVITAGGPWTSTLVRSGDKWLVLDVSYVDQPGPAESAAGKEITALEHAWAKAYVDRDVTTLERLEADDWVCTDNDGKQTTKAEDIADIKSATYQATAFKMEDVKVRVYGDTAVATALQTEVATYKGADASKVLRCTDTWLRRDGRWQCVATHLSNVKK